MAARPDRPNILVATKGHPFDKAAFFAMFDAMRGLDWTHAEQPAAMHLFAPEIARNFAAFVLYDVPGIRFRTPEPPRLIDPPESFRRDFEALLAMGHPFVVLHHALAGWPLFDRYAELAGARFFYQPGTYKGRAYADSGYSFPVRHEVECLADHPVTEGLGPGFTIDDELYLLPLLEDDVVPLLRSRHAFTSENFHSAAEALRGRMRSRENWRHPPGTDLVAWARRLGRSPVVVIQGGNDAGAFGHEGFRRLVRNAIDWVTGEAARDWARAGRA